MIEHGWRAKSLRILHLKWHFSDGGSRASVQMIVEEQGRFSRDIEVGIKWQQYEFNPGYG